MKFPLESFRQLERAQADHDNEQEALRQASERKKRPPRLNIRLSVHMTLGYEYAEKRRKLAGAAKANLCLRTYLRMNLGLLFKLM